MIVRSKTRLEKTKYYICSKKDIISKCCDIMEKREHSIKVGNCINCIDNYLTQRCVVVVLWSH